jgi:catechol 2,3-dioxygenase-like lactoylglutathione lyase family enzyme
MASNALNHVQFNVSAGNFDFYRRLLSQLGFEVQESEHYVAGFGNGVSLWFMPSDVSEQQDHDHRGVNHLGLNAETVAEVDAVAAFLPEIGAEALFETPRRRDDFIGGGETDYYQVMFRSPDGILFEVVYTGPLVSA